MLVKMSRQKRNNKHGDRKKYRVFQKVQHATVVRKIEKVKREQKFMDWRAWDVREPPYESEI